VPPKAILEFKNNSTILINQGIIVDKGGTLLINSGVQLRFIPHRDYKKESPRPYIKISGTIIATGTETDRIWFTSNDRTTPVNDDWSGIFLTKASHNSRFDYVIVEYANVGIEFAATKKATAVDKYVKQQPQVLIKNSIVRWSTVEGIYSEHSSFTVDRCLLYQNAFHEIALEHENKNIVIKDSVFSSGMGAIIIMDSEADVTGNRFCDYEEPPIGVADHTGQFAGSVNITDNAYWSKSNLLFTSSSDSPGTVQKKYGNTLLTGANASNSCIYGVFKGVGVPNIEKTKLGWIPCSLPDKNYPYPYVYAQCDETRCWKRFGAGLGMSWGLTWANGYLWWTAGGGLVRFDPNSSPPSHVLVPLSRKAKKQIAPEFELRSQALAFDGKYFWMIEDSTIQPSKGVLLLRISVNFNKRFPRVESVDHVFAPKGTTKSGIACDGSLIYLQKDGEKNKNKLTGYLPKRGGGLLWAREITFAYEKGDSESLAGHFCWHNNGFWAKTTGPSAITYFKIEKQLGNNLQAKAAHYIYQIAFDTIGITWGGGYLWTMQKACETRHKEGHVFRVQIPRVIAEPDLLPIPPRIRVLIPHSQSIPSEIIGDQLLGLDRVAQPLVAPFGSAHVGSHTELAAAPTEGRLEDLSQQPSGFTATVHGQPTAKPTSPDAGSLEILQPSARGNSHIEVLQETSPLDVATPAPRAPVVEPVVASVEEPPQTVTTHSAHSVEGQPNEELLNSEATESLEDLSMAERHLMSR